MGIWGGGGTIYIYILYTSYYNSYDKGPFMVHVVPKVRLDIPRKVINEDQADVGDVDAPPEDVRGNQDPDLASAKPWLLFNPPIKA